MCLQSRQWLHPIRARWDGAMQSLGPGGQSGLCLLCLSGSGLAPVLIPTLINDGLHPLSQVLIRGTVLDL